jgi:glycosyltransferase involved in cell wall biosynthesis
MRILLIGQQCQVRSEGQAKAVRLAEFADIELMTLAPDRYFVEGKRLRRPDPPERPAYAYKIGKVLWPWTGPGQWYLHWYPGLAKVLRAFRPEVIDLWEEPWSLVSAQTCWLRNRLLPGARIVSETEQNVNKVLPFPFEKFRSYTLRNADFLVGRNAEAVEISCKKGYRGPAAVAPNGVDIEVFSPQDRMSARAALHFSGFVCGYVGRIVEEKGLAEMVESLADCAPDVNLVFVGSGPFQPELERLVRELKREGQVRFLPNRGRERLPELMSAFDVLLLPSRTTLRWKEQFGRVIIEAHACGTPVIGSDSGAIPAVIGEGGAVVPEQNPAALAAAISKFRANPGLRDLRGGLGRQQVEDHYSWQKVAARMREIYLSLRPRSEPSKNGKNEQAN